MHVFGVDVYDALPLIAVGLVLATIPFVLLLVIRRVLIDRRYRRQLRLRSRSGRSPRRSSSARARFPRAGCRPPRRMRSRSCSAATRACSAVRAAARSPPTSSTTAASRAASASFAPCAAWRRAHAARLLGDIGSPLAVAPLIAALRDRSTDVRRTAAESLGRIGAVEAVEPILAALSDESPARPVAGRALLAIGPAALGRVMIVARNPDHRDPPARHRTASPASVAPPRLRS